MDDDPLTLGEALPREIERCQKLLEIYEAIGPEGRFGYIAIKADIRMAEEAMASGDIVKMITAYKALKGCE